MRPITEAQMAMIRSGDRCAFSRRLTDSLVAQMRRDYGRVVYGEKGYLKRRAVTLDELAAMYGVHKNTVSKVIRRETWQHVP